MCTTRLRHMRVRGGFRASWRWLEITGLITLTPICS